MKHELKIWPQYYCRVADGSKTFEVRKNDRGYQPGDTVVLHEYDPTPHEVKGEPPGLPFYSSLTPKTHLQEKGFTTAKPLEFKVGYVYQLDAERVVFSLLTPTTERDE